MNLLEHLLSHELAQDERSARGLILAGKVLVDDIAVTSAGYKLKTEQQVRIKAGVSADVSRGAGKLRPVLAELNLRDPGFDPAGKVCIDLGASTGGFTQVLLERQAGRVYAIDVGYGLLAGELRNNPRVVVLDRTNIRLIERGQVPERAALLVGDLSFISWSAVLPAVLPLLEAQARLLLLVKPQFELAAAGRAAALEQGVLRDLAVLRECLAGLYNLWSMHELAAIAMIPAGLRGAQGNQEYFAALRQGSDGLTRAQYEDCVDAAIARSAV